MTNTMEDQEKRWTRRHKALQDQINALLLRKDTSNEARGLTEDMSALLKRLQEFQDNGFKLLSHGYFNSEVKPKELTGIADTLNLKPSDLAGFFSKDNRAYPPDFVFSQLMRQIGIDFLRLKQATDQEKKDESWEVAESLARRAIAPCRETHLMGYQAQEQVIVTYPTNHVEVRLLPYANAIFIGFPITATSKLLDEKKKLENDPYISPTFLTIAHETAHMIYRSGREPLDLVLKASGEKNQIDQPLIRKKLERLIFAEMAKKGLPRYRTSWLLRWLEEIFADVYGCFVEGPVYVVGFQDLMITDHPTKEMGHPEDNVHPIPVLRPIIHSKILNLLVQKFPLINGDDEKIDAPTEIEKITAALDKEWLAAIEETWPRWVDEVWPFGQLENNGANLLNHATFEIDGEEYSGEFILKVIEIAISVIIDQMGEWGFTEAKNWPRLPDMEQAKTANKSIKGVQQAQSKTANKSIKERMLKSYGLLVQSSFKQENDNLSSRTLHLESTMKSLVNDHFGVDKKPTHDELINLLIFNGWSDEGPKGGIDPGN